VLKATEETDSYHIALKKANKTDERPKDEEQAEEQRHDEVGKL